MLPDAVKAVQAPFTQTCSAGHTLPGAPQLLLSVESETQAPPSMVKPAGHADRHAALRHACPASQPLVQEPHCAKELWPTHRSLHSCRSAPQESWQAPPTQLWVGPQTVPHAPQLATLLARMTQAPLQLVCPGGQVAVHAPLTQVCPAPQALKHVPQLVDVFWRSTQVRTHWVSPLGQLATQAPFAHT